MKRSIRTVLGVTLLEIMLVLAIAGVVIAMSIRYYQQAATNQKVTAGMSAVMAVSSAVEQWILGGGNTGLKTDIPLDKYFPGSSVPKSPWTSDLLTAKGADSGGKYDITITTTDQASCVLLIDQIKTQPNFQNSSCVNGTGTVKVNY